MSRVEPAFILSLPRSGSTLLQRLLAAHSRVASAAEPWLLLPPLYALREKGVYAEYDHSFTVRAINGICELLPGGRNDYLEAVAGMARHVYEQLSPPGTKVFIDKTPRYGLVVDELVAAFPTAKIFVLHRNPLAVLASICSTFDRGSWEPYRHKQDLYLLPERLLAAQQRTPDAFVSVGYEDLVANPETTLTRLFAALGLEWEPEVLSAFVKVSATGAVGDPTGVEAYDHISLEPLSKWQQELASPVRRAWTQRYLRWLGAERLELMGYNLETLLNDLDGVPSDYSDLLADLTNLAKGVVWSIAEVEATREKLRRLPAWRQVFTHT